MILRNIQIAIDSILANKLRAVLTTLGIIFGVAAVIAMLAIGNGAQQKILDQLKIVGVNNVFIHSEFSDEIDDGGEETTKTFSPGLTIDDYNNIKTLIPYFKYSSPEIAYECYANSSKKREKTKLIGVNEDYFKLFALELSNGKFFTNTHDKYYKNVCVLGSKIGKKLFPNSSPVGKTIRVNKLNLKVIGVLKNLSGIGENLQSMGINNYNNEIYMPVNTLLTRFKDRSDIRISEQDYWGDEDEEKPKRKNHNQLDKIAIQFEESSAIEGSVLLINRILSRRHNQAKDFSIVIPEQLLKQQKETDDLFNILLGAIASISLIVGGIGIMNIMLASVMERIREIGLRMAIGARKKDIKAQFVFEALFISVSGGIVGIFLGVLLSYLIEMFLKMPVKISNFSIFISFFISVIVGIVFGYLPAKKAAEQDPVTSLRYE